MGGDSSAPIRHQLKKSQSLIAVLRLRPGVGAGKSIRPNWVAAPSQFLPGCQQLPVVEILLAAKQGEGHGAAAQESPLISEESADADHSGEGPGMFQRHPHGHARTPGETGGVTPLRVHIEAGADLVPKGLLGLEGGPERAILRVVGPHHDETQPLRGLLEEPHRIHPTGIRSEGEEDRPGAVASIGAGQVEGVAVGWSFQARDPWNDHARGERICQQDSRGGQGGKTAPSPSTAGSSRGPAQQFPLQALQSL